MRPATCIPGIGATPPSPDELLTPGTCAASIAAMMCCCCMPARPICIPMSPDWVTLSITAAPFSPMSSHPFFFRSRGGLRLRLRL